MWCGRKRCTSANRKTGENRTTKSICKQAASVSGVVAAVPLASAGAVLCAVVPLLAVQGRDLAITVDGRTYPTNDCASSGVAAAVAAVTLAAINDAAADTSVTETVAFSAVVGAAVSVTAAVAATIAAAIAAAAAAVTDAAGGKSVTDTDAVAAAAARVISYRGGTIAGSGHHVRVLELLPLRETRDIITAPAIADADAINSSLPHEQHITSTATPAALGSRTVIAGAARAVSRSVEQDVGVGACRSGVGQWVLEAGMIHEAVLPAAATSAFEIQRGCTDSGLVPVPLTSFTSTNAAHGGPRGWRRVSCPRRIHDHGPAVSGASPPRYCRCCCCCGDDC